ncbi:sugar transferase [Gammaproteobacteria bacterium]|nr:sugar transferase [Gammaproteobacteria bacterium]
MDIDLKRIFDVVVSFTGIILLLPILTIISGLISIFDGFPILFIHKRVGLNFKGINIYKFRTMKKIKDSNKRFDLGSRERITNLGSFLRRLKLDELPQLYNVLRGDLSLVGPRPEVEGWIDPKSKDWQKILSIKPGITDLASIEFSNEEYILDQSSDPRKTYKENILPKKIAISIKYVEKNSILSDIVIIIRTLIKIIF